ncbi:retinol dehydrogenase 14 isoform X1 [Atheta coriaria]|uniref:retinol dehydrogenase 14 isoform X1 n=2 Tax=Dalotia coriaria TaxID=877792 RepID=UPI0031F35115
MLYYWGIGLCSACLLLLGAACVFGVALIVLLKLYAQYTCGYYRGNAKMDGKTVIVTGGNGGIGKETARELAKRGARVILACRNIETGNIAKEEIVKDSKNDNVIVKKLDLSSFASIREFAADINRTEPKLHVLIHNAGTAETRSKVSEDGLELTMATNHYGPFLLTHLLIDLLIRTRSARIVVVASELYRLASLNLSKLNPVDAFLPAYLYYVSKYANICFTNELARRLEETGVTANCLHPGMIDSGIWRNVPAPLSWPLMLIVKGFFKTPVQGCQTSVYLACSEEVEGVTGKYFMDCKERGLSSGAADMNKAKKLWEASEEYVKLKETDPKI